MTKQRRRSEWSKSSQPEHEISHRQPLLAQTSFLYLEFSISLCSFLFSLAISACPEFSLVSKLFHVPWVFVVLSLCFYLFFFFCSIRLFFMLPFHYFYSRSSFFFLLFSFDFVFQFYSNYRFFWSFLLRFFSFAFFFVFFLAFPCPSLFIFISFSFSDFLHVFFILVHFHLSFVRPVHSVSTSEASKTFPFPLLTLFLFRTSESLPPSPSSFRSIAFVSALRTSNYPWPHDARQIYSGLLLARAFRCDPPEASISSVFHPTFLYPEIFSIFSLRLLFFDKFSAEIWASPPALLSLIKAHLFI